MKTFLSLAAAVIALALTGIKLTSAAYPAEAQALLHDRPAKHQALVRHERNSWFVGTEEMSGFRM